MEQIYGSWIPERLSDQSNTAPVDYCMLLEAAAMSKSWVINLFLLIIGSGGKKFLPWKSQG